MSSKQNQTTGYTGKPVAFGCHSDTAEAVFLAGSFNDWDPTATPMARGNGGQWTALLEAGAGAI